jgi:transposase
MEQGRSSVRGRPRLRPKRVVGDKGYSSRKVRRYLARRGIQPVIARRAKEPQQRDFDRERYRERNCVERNCVERNCVERNCVERNCVERNCVERLINRLKQFRRVATRYEKLAEHYLGMVTLAAILLWIG